MNISLLFKSIHQTINSAIPKMLSMVSIPNVLDRRIHSICDRQRLNPIAKNLSSHSTSALLQPDIPTCNLMRGMKVKGRLELRCKGCYYVARNERLFVMCKTHPRHKQTQMKKREYKTWILTSASQSKVRGW